MTTTNNSINCNSQLQLKRAQTLKGNRYKNRTKEKGTLKTYKCWHEYNYMVIY